MKNTKEIRNKSFETKLGQVSIQKELGKGKSGYSYLVEFGGQNLVLKIMHYESCDYYSFGGNNKVTLEVNAYHKLHTCGVLLPKLLSYDAKRNYLLKEYIDGEVASHLIAENKISESIIEQLFDMYHNVKKYGLNIDYFPNNFVIKNDRLFYIDYECNPYSPAWDLLNWGIYYWANSEGFKEYLLTDNVSIINDIPEKGIPIKSPFEEKVANWKKRYNIGLND